MTVRTSLPGRAVQQGLARVLTLAFGLALLVAVSRKGPQVQGAFALFVAVESALLALCSGLGQVLARAVSQDHPAAGLLLRSLLRLATAIGAVAAAGLSLVAALTPSLPYSHLWLLALAAPLLLWAPTASGHWLGRGQMLALNAPLVAAPALVLALLAVAPWLFDRDLPLLGVLAAWVVAKCVVAAVTGVAALRAAPGLTEATDRQEPKLWALLRRYGGFIALVALANVISLLNLRATFFLVERLHGLAAAGVYSVAVQVAELLWVLSSAVSVAAYGGIGAADRLAAARLTLQVVRTGLALAIAAAPVLGAMAWWLLPQVLGAEYAAARAPLMILLPGVTLYAAASGLSAFHTNQLGRPQWAARVAGLSLALTLALAWPAVAAWGAIGAALATTLAYAVAITAALRGFLRDHGWGWRQLWHGAPPAQSVPA